MVFCLVVKKFCGFAEGIFQRRNDEGELGFSSGFEAFLPNILRKIFI